MAPKRRVGQPLVEWLKETRLSTEEAYKAVAVLFVLTIFATALAKVLITALLAV